ncbi:MAG: hypothetical protein HYX37_04675 [Rhizobiales bacterium]|nr:hypothetical protein [Hyphomicrobiales bacterium]
MPKTAIPANPISMPSLGRRALLVGAATAAASAFVPAAASAPHDSRLAALERAFDAALAEYEAAQWHYNACEQRFFAACPDPPAILTCDGPLAKLLCNDWSWVNARDLQWLLRQPKQRRLRKAARAALPVAKAYEAEIRRVKRACGLAAAEVAQVAAMDCLHELSERIAGVPARALADLAVKARVVRRWAAPEWWNDAGPAELLARQVLDAVMGLAAGK